MQSTISLASINPTAVALTAVPHANVQGTTKDLANSSLSPLSSVEPAARSHAAEAYSISPASSPLTNASEPASQGAPGVIVSISGKGRDHGDDSRSGEDGAEPVSVTGEPESGAPFSESPLINATKGNEPGDSEPIPEAPRAESPSVVPSTNTSGRLSEAELRQISVLSARDDEVRAHEQQHQAVGGQYAGSASFSYTTGPDGVKYAVGGEVGIDISPVANDPRATIEKMRVVRAAALAPAEPSSQDRAVAAEATRLMLQAQAELAQQSADERKAQEESRAAAREQSQKESETSAQDDRNRTSGSIRMYEELIRLGKIYDNGLPQQPDLDQFV